MRDSMGEREFTLVMVSIGVGTFLGLFGILNMQARQKRPCREERIENLRHEEEALKASIAAQNAQVDTLAKEILDLEARKKKAEGPKWYTVGQEMSRIDMEDGLSCVSLVHAPGSMNCFYPPKKENVENGQ